MALMNKQVIVAAGLLLFAASNASAQVTAVITGGGSSVTLTNGTTTQNDHNIASQIGDSSSNQAGNFQVVSDLTQNNIVFANNGSAEGSFASVTSSTSLAITYTNSGALAVTPQLESTITPGGFGFYTALNQDPNGTAIGNINNSPSSNAPFSAFQTNDPFLAGVSFSVSIASDGVVFESYSATLTVTPAVQFGMNAGPPVVTLTTGGDTASLNGFGLLTPAGSQNEVGYQWNATDVTLTIPGGALAPGASRTLTYDTQVTAFTDGSAGLCGGTFQCPQLFAYSGFGDPIGKGSGAGLKVNFGAAALGADQSSGISGVYFPRFQFGIPTFDPLTGALSLPLSDQLLPALPLTVPEPETWVLMLMGLGGAGLALRRRARRQPA
jgi:hypothetical protein